MNTMTFFQFLFPKDLFKTKLFIAALLLLSVERLNAQDVRRDTAYHDNGLIAEIFDFDYTQGALCGYYLSYDSLGHKRVEGHYQLVDSIYCQACYEGFAGENFIAYTRAITRTLRTGEWFFYHPNGQIASHGFYANRVHEFHGSHLPAQWENRPVNVYIDVEYLKAGSWEQYLPDGAHAETVEYLDGEIVFKTTYD